jgi:hypothetical protein
MPTDEQWNDGLDTALASLHVYDAGRERVGRIRARAVMTLAERRRHRGSGVQRAAWCRALEPALTLGLSALYFAGAVWSSMALYW